MRKSWWNFFRNFNLVVIGTAVKLTSWPGERLDRGCLTIFVREKHGLAVRQIWTVNIVWTVSHCVPVCMTTVYFWFSRVSQSESTWHLVKVGETPQIYLKKLFSLLLHRRDIMNLCAASSERGDTNQSEKALHSF